MKVISACEALKRTQESIREESAFVLDHIFAQIEEAIAEQHDAVEVDLEGFVLTPKQLLNVRDYLKDRGYRVCVGFSLGQPTSIDVDWSIY